MTMLTRVFGTLLRNARLFAGLSQNDLAERLQKRQSFLSKIETGSGRPTLDTVELYSEAVDCVPLLVLLPQGPSAASADREVIDATISSLRTAIFKIQSALDKLE
jgi:transcriptional regulator with XRE-family HTH domain